MSRPIFEIAEELIANVSEGEFGKAFRSVKLTNTHGDEDAPAPSWVVIVAKGEDAARISQAYDQSVNEEED